jgi:hypothetical protein
LFPRGRGRGKGGEVKCYSYVKIGHMYWECPKKKNVGGRQDHISKGHRKNVEKYLKVEAKKEGI